MNYRAPERHGWNLITITKWKKSTICNSGKDQSMETSKKNQWFLGVGGEVKIRGVLRQRNYSTWAYDGMLKSVKFTPLKVSPTITKLEVMICQCKVIQFLRNVLLIMDFMYIGTENKGMRYRSMSLFFLL